MRSSSHSLSFPCRDIAYLFYDCSSRGFIRYKDVESNGHNIFEQTELYSLFCIKRLGKRKKKVNKYRDFVRYIYIRTYIYIYIYIYISDNHDDRHSKILTSVSISQIFNQSVIRDPYEMLVMQFGRWLWHIMGGSGTQVFCSLLIFVTVVLVSYWLYLKYSRICKLPPGPWGLPYCGYIPFIKEGIHLHFTKLAKKYGGIFSVSMGSELTVVLSDYRIIRDSFRREDFSGKPHDDFMNIIDGYGKCQAQQISIIHFISRL